MKKNDSIWLVVFCRSAINAFGSLAGYIVASADQESWNQILGLASAGLFGMIPVGITALFTVREMFRKK